MKRIEPLDRALSAWKTLTDADTAAELRWLLAEVRAINKVYGGKDLILNGLIAKLVDRQKAAEMSK